MTRARDPSSAKTRLSAAWSAAHAEALCDRGFAHLPALLDAAQCRAFVGLFDDAARFRKTVVMQRHGFGHGVYRYFADPLPAELDALRSALYRQLAPVANRFQELLGNEARFPSELQALHAQCQTTGQTLPTPLLLRYEPGDYNCLHQDLYGATVFPLQVAILLDQPGVDFEGGEFVLVEQRPRMQSVPTVVPLQRGDAVAFACSQRPRRGARGYHRSQLRHGVSEVRAGRRHVLGLIFHHATT